MNEQLYNKISTWFRKSDVRLKLFVFAYRLLPYVTVLGYAASVIYEILYGATKEIAGIILVPAVTFGICTIFRKIVNAKRPYEEMAIEPLIIKNKRGQSFPSRHMVSAGVIAMAALYVNTVFGIGMLAVAVSIGILRPIAGVHYIKDVIAGLAIGVLCGIIGFYFILN